MKSARLIVGAVAVVSGGVAFFLSMSGPAPVPVETPKPVVIQSTDEKTVEILSAARELPIGTVINEGDMAWMRWPEKIVSPAMVQRMSQPDALAAYKGAVTRQAFYSGEPIRPEKVIKSGGGGYMSLVLTPGMRAVAIRLDARGGTNAGGFILPNDRVDVIAMEQTMRGTNARTILRKIRVLAVGQQIQEKDGERVITGENATLELDPVQAEMITRAQASGGGAGLTLALRPAHEPDDSDASTTTQRESSITFVRSGVTQ